MARNVSLTCRMPDYLEIVPVLATGLFAGAALGITIGDQPARECIEPQAAREHFKEWYPRIAKPQVGNAAHCAMIETQLYSQNLVGLMSEPPTRHEDDPRKDVLLVRRHPSQPLLLHLLPGWHTRVVQPAA